MIIFKHALKRCLSQRIHTLAIFLLPAGIIFIPQQGNYYPNGLYLYGMIIFTAFLLLNQLWKNV